MSLFLTAVAATIPAGTFAVFLYYLFIRHTLKKAGFFKASKTPSLELQIL
ncbi:hypothetical protein IFO70_18905 [Phormidium tenue FACHB-886]|nr:hypothetical protein [Phormidium tenue FACHB-886]